MISKELIKKGLECGVIKLIKNPNMGTGTVCKIGGYWFYFDYPTADDLTPDEYMNKVPLDDIADKICDSLENDYGGLDSDEREYYESYLREKVLS